MNMLWPIAMIVVSNTLYNICAKSVPGEADSFAALCVTYLTAAGASVALFFLANSNRHLLAELGKVNWVSLVLGIVIVGLEFGYVAAYRAGWQVSTCSLTANITLACVLVAVGAVLYRESISLRQLAGIAVCGAGLFLISGHG